MSEMRIDLLRHGEVEGGRVYRGSRDDALTNEGWGAMHAAVGDTREWTRIISSPLQRCRAFAEELAAQLGVPLAIDARWREIHFGDWEGKSADELMQSCPEAITRFWEDPERHTPPNGETLAAFCARVEEVWDDVVAQPASERLLIVTHGGPIRFILGRACGLPVAETLRLDIPLAYRCRMTIEPVRARHDSLQGEIA